MMQRSTICRNRELTSDEIHVAQLLLDITTMIRTHESGLDLKWGTKKRRSRFNDHEIDVGLRQTKAAAAASSPVTPLSFCPAESDDQRPNHLLNKKSKKMSRGEYMEMIEELSQRRDLLRGEIEEVSIYYNKLIAQNSQLKAIKQEVLNYCCPRKEELKLETSIVGNRATKLIPPQISVENETRLLPHISFGPIPDLNMCAEEMDPYEALDRRAMFAEARRRRKDIIRVKSFKFPRTK